MSGLVTVKLVMLSNVKTAPMNVVPMKHVSTTTSVMTALVIMTSVVMDLTIQISVNVMTNHADTDCINTHGAFECIFVLDYEGDAIIGCSDIDECTNETGKCDDATCSNNVGSYTCACHIGSKAPDVLVKTSMSARLVTTPVMVSMPCVRIFQEHMTAAVPMDTIWLSLSFQVESSPWIRCR